MGPIFHEKSRVNGSDFHNFPANHLENLVCFVAKSQDPERFQDMGTLYLETLPLNMGMGLGGTSPTDPNLSIPPGHILFNNENTRGNEPLIGGSYANSKLFVSRSYKL